MDWKDFLKLNLFKILFIIAVFLVFGLPYSYQISVTRPIGLEAAKERGLPPSAAFSEEYGEYGNSHYGFRPLWSWDFSYETARFQSYPPKFKFSFSIVYFILILFLLYLLSCLIFAVYGTIDKNSNTAGRLYSRIGIILFAIIVIAWRLNILSIQLFGFGYRRVAGILILATWIASIAMVVVGIIGYRKQDKLASIIVIIVSIVAALYGFIGQAALFAGALL